MNESARETSRVLLRNRAALEIENRRERALDVVLDRELSAGAIDSRGSARRAQPPWMMITSASAATGGDALPARLDSATGDYTSREL